MFWLADGGRVARKAARLVVAPRPQSHWPDAGLAAFPNDPGGWRTCRCPHARESEKDFVGGWKAWLSALRRRCFGAETKCAKCLRISTTEFKCIIGCSKRPKSRTKQVLLPKIHPQILARRRLFLRWGDCLSGR